MAKAFEYLHEELEGTNIHESLGFGTSIPKEFSWFSVFNSDAWRKHSTETISQ
jgi:hypothetical protein